MNDKPQPKPDRGGIYVQLPDGTKVKLPGWRIGPPRKGKA